MKIYKLKRIPNETIYNIFYTLIIAITIIWIIFYFTPNNHCSIYFK